MSCLRGKVSESRFFSIVSSMNSAMSSARFPFEMFCQLDCNLAGVVVLEQPIPEGKAEIQGMMQVSGLAELFGGRHFSNGLYSIKADRPSMSTMVTDNSEPWTSVSRIGLPGRNGTGCCRPSSIAMLLA